MNKYKKLFQYLKDNNTPHNFNFNTNELYLNRQVLTHDLRTYILSIGMNIFELDTLIIIF
jgi:hypothetical protein